MTARLTGSADGTPSHELMPVTPSVRVNFVIPVPFHYGLSGPRVNCRNPRQTDKDRTCPSAEMSYYHCND